MRPVLPFPTTVARFFTGSVLFVVGCSGVAYQERDPQRVVVEAECRAWAEARSRSEFGPAIRQGYNAQTNSALLGNSAGVALGGAATLTAQAAMWDREIQLRKACMQTRGYPE
jgi:hypothetical protein